MLAFRVDLDLLINCSIVGWVGSVEDGVYTADLFWKRAEAPHLPTSGLGSMSIADFSLPFSAVLSMDLSTIGFSKYF